MDSFFTDNQIELLWTLITFIVLVILQFIGHKTIRRIGRLSDIVEARTKLITKYVSIVLGFLGIAVLTFIWGLDVRDIGVLASSIFAVIGVALFASWSILSNITAGVILFFSFPFKIGDRIKIMDKEIIEDQLEGQNTFIIEDIKAFHVHLRKGNGELVTYPNNLILQKAVVLINTYHEIHDGSEAL